MARYEPDSRGMARIARSRAVGSACEQAAEAAIPFAQSISPVESGDYRNSFRVEPATVTVKGEKRAGARLVNDSDYAAAVEWVNGDRVLARTADHIESG